MVNTEKQYYNIDPAKIVSETSIPSWPTETLANTKLYYNHNSIPPASPNPNYPSGVSPTQTAGSTKLYKLNATTNKTGLEFVIKVMAGDKVDILGKSYFLNTSNITNSNSTPLNLLSLVTNLLLAPVNPIAGKGITAAQLNTSAAGVPTTFFRGANNESTTTKPKAYINYIFLDEQFKFAGGSFSRAGSSGTVKDHWTDGLQDINVPKNGYLFVYISNESNLDVFFDNLQVVHKPGPLVEETHYYPFGLTMAGISSKAAGSIDNDIKFNGKELSEDLELDWYEYGFRNNFDPQLGRFHSVDPLASDYPYYTPYQFAGNQPTIAIDVDGLEPAFINDIMQWAATKFATNPNSNTSKVIGAVTGVGKSIEKTITGVGNAIAHPINTLQGVANLTTPEGITNIAISTGNKVDAYQNGTGFEKSAMISEAVTDVITAIVGTKGIGGGVKGAGAVGEVAGVVKTVSPNVQKVLNILNGIKAEGGTVKVNPLKPTQEINMTIQKGSSKMDFRIETHKLPPKYGGDGVTPVKHMNVDLKPKGNLPNNGHKILE